MKSITRYSDHQGIGITLIVLCGMAAAWAVLSLAIQTGWDWKVDSSHIDHIGSYFSGLVGIVSIYYLYRTLRSQSLSFRMSSFESRFVKMIELQREKTKELTIQNTTADAEANGNRPVLRGQDAIRLFIKQYKEALEVVETQLNPVQIRDLYRTQETYEKDCSIWGETMLKNRTISNIAYLLVFEGVKKAGVELLKNKYLNKYTQDQVETILRLFQLQLAGERHEDENRHVMQEADNLLNEDKRYAGYQQEFGNYFRQLFQIVNHVNCQEWLEYGDKYGYVKMLRSQLSNQEEDLLFYNSLSDLGMAWEYKDREAEIPDINNQLLTKYNLLKNIPHNTTTPNVEEFYPLISYEDVVTIVEGREELENKYN